MIEQAVDVGIEALAALVERSRDGIVVCTPERRYVYANPAACRVMGYSLEELLELPDFLVNFPEREHEAMLEHFAEQLAGSTGLWTSKLLRPEQVPLMWDETVLGDILQKGKSIGSGVAW